ncbi:MAG: type II toxin-antitoxin system antitoxin SocA domain-containing protein [Candidatus Paceibacterota bacterium]|jgi:uncharacterized phage-associated protein
MNKLAVSVPASSIAEYFIQKSNLSSPRRVITNKKIQKLVYYAQAWSLAINKRPLFEEKIEAWVHGPAIKSVYDRYKKFGFSVIKKEPDLALIKVISENDKNILEQVWDVYGKYDSSYLEMLTHSELPWQKAREGLTVDESSENEISIASMQEFYSSKLKKN